jgi:hypothetical protein
VNTNSNTGMAFTVNGEAMPAITRLFMRNRRITNVPNFEQAHLEFDTELRRYTTTKRGRSALSPAAKLCMREDVAMSLKATNAWSRIAYMKSAIAVFDRYAEARGAIQPVFFVTVAPSHLAFDFNRALPDVVRDRFQIATMFSKAHSFGAFDIAYHGNVNATDNVGTRMLSLHAHLLVWGVEENAMQELKRAYNSRVRSAIPPNPAFYYMSDSPIRFKEHLIYLLKAPLREYRRDQRSAEAVALATDGGPGGRAGPWKRDLRPKDAASMCNLLANVTIPGWIISSGDGVDLARRAERRAIDALERDKNNRLTRFRSLIGN